MMDFLEQPLYKNKKGFGGYKNFLERIKTFTKEEVERIKKPTFQASLKPFKRKKQKGRLCKEPPLT